MCSSIVHTTKLTKEHGHGWLSVAQAMCCWISFDTFAPSTVITSCFVNEFSICVMHLAVVFATPFLCHSIDTRQWIILQNGKLLVVFTFHISHMSFTHLNKTCYYGIYEVDLWSQNWWWFLQHVQKGGGDQASYQGFLYLLTEADNQVDR